VWITIRQLRVEFMIGKKKYKPTRQSGELFFPLTDPTNIFGQLFF
jgi:hypothetical protein